MEKEDRLREEEKEMGIFARCMYTLAVVILSVLILVVSVLVVLEYHKLMETEKVVIVGEDKHEGQLQIKGKWVDVRELKATSNKEFTDYGCVGSIVSVGNCDMQVTGIRLEGNEYKIKVMIRNNGDKYIRVEDNEDTYYLDNGNTPLANTVRMEVEVDNVERDIKLAEESIGVVIGKNSSQELVFTTGNKLYPTRIKLIDGEDSGSINMCYELENYEVMKKECMDIDNISTLGYIEDIIYYGNQCLVVEGCYPFVENEEFEITSYKYREPYSIWARIHNESNSKYSMYGKYKFLVYDTEGYLYEERCYTAVENTLNRRDTIVGRYKTEDGTIHFNTYGKPSHLIIEDLTEGSVGKVNLEKRDK